MRLRDNFTVSYGLWQSGYTWVALPTHILPGDTRFPL